MAEISKITIPVGNSTQTYDIKDSTARAAIAGGVTFAGVTTTALTDGASTASISINGESVTAINGMMAVYGNKEFIYASSDSKWHEFGDVSTLGSLAFKDSASGTATNPTTDSIYKVTSTGSMPSFAVSNETLTITAGVVPQLAQTATTVISAIGTVTVS